MVVMPGTEEAPTQHLMQELSLPMVNTAVPTSEDGHEEDGHREDGHEEAAECLAECTTSSITRAAGYRSADTARRRKPSVWSDSGDYEGGEEAKADFVLYHKRPRGNVKDWEVRTSSAGTKGGKGAFKGEKETFIDQMRSRGLYNWVLHEGRLVDLSDPSDVKRLSGATLAKLQVAAVEAQCEHEAREEELAFFSLPASRQDPPQEESDGRLQDGTAPAAAETTMSNEELVALINLRCAQADAVVPKKACSEEDAGGWFVVEAANLSHEVCSLEEDEDGWLTVKALDFGRAEALL
mmetsp:Transcript_79970/g.226254  ORF Transcript_79970/g.226254 Transcript_79970/m.226254 type:complete len:295 (+) Transcript_79970:50-934(+)